MLEIITYIKTKQCSIMCDECYAKWSNPENALKNNEGFRTTATEITVRAATIEEIKEINWEKYIIYSERRSKCSKRSPE
jgi:hypothetical protein